MEAFGRKNVVVLSEPWLDQAACRSHHSPDDFFPPKGGGVEQYKTAKAICGGCPVRAECLSYVLKIECSSPRSGLWGGLTPHDRDLLAGTRGGRSKSAC